MVRRQHPVMMMLDENITLTVIQKPTGIRVMEDPPLSYEEIRDVLLAAVKAAEDAIAMRDATQSQSPDEPPDTQGAAVPAGADPPFDATGTDAIIPITVGTHSLLHVVTPEESAGADAD